MSGSSRVLVSPQAEGGGSVEMVVSDGGDVGGEGARGSLGMALG